MGRRLSFCAGVGSEGYLRSDRAGRPTGSQLREWRRQTVSDVRVAIGVRLSASEYGCIRFEFHEDT